MSPIEYGGDMIDVVEKRGDIINLDNKPPISIIAISNNETAAIQ